MYSHPIILRMHGVYTLGSIMYIHCHLKIIIISSNLAVTVVSCLDQINIHDYKVTDICTSHLRDRLGTYFSTLCAQHPFTSLIRMLSDFPLQLSFHMYKIMQDIFWPTNIIIFLQYIHTSKSTPTHTCTHTCMHVHIRCLYS